MKIFYFETKTLISNHKNLKKSIKEEKLIIFWLAVTWSAKPAQRQIRPTRPNPNPKNPEKSASHHIRSRFTWFAASAERKLIFGVQKSMNAEVFGCFSGFFNFSNFGWYWNGLAINFDFLAWFLARSWFQIDLAWNFKPIQILSSLKFDLVCQHVLELQESIWIFMEMVFRL